MKEVEIKSHADAKGTLQTSLADGGFSRDTQVMTSTGPVTVSELTSGDLVLALNPATQIVKPKHVVQVQRVHDITKIVALETRRSDLRLAPDHRFCYTTKSMSSPRFSAAGELEEWFQRRFLNDWRPRSGSRLESIDITNLIDYYEIFAASTDHGNTFRCALPKECAPDRRKRSDGYYFSPETFKQYQAEIESVADRTAIHAGSNARLRPYQFEGDDFIEFLGWYITEGSVSWRKAKDTATIDISQKTSETRGTIKSLFDRLGITVSVTHGAFSFSSTLFGELLEGLCGADSYHKRIPSFIWDVSSRQKKLLLDTLMQGDGNDFNVYYTASNELAGGVLRLALELGMKPRYSERGDVWQIFLNTTTDGFRSDRNLTWEENTEPLYRLTIEDFSVVMAGRNGKFQWVGVSGVA